MHNASNTPLRDGLAIDKLGFTHTDTFICVPVDPEAAIADTHTHTCTDTLFHFCVKKTVLTPSKDFFFFKLGMHAFIRVLQKGQILGEQHMPKQNRSLLFIHHCFCRIYSHVFFYKFFFNHFDRYHFDRYHIVLLLTQKRLTLKNCIRKKSSLTFYFGRILFSIIYRLAFSKKCVLL